MAISPKPPLAPAKDCIEVSYSVHNQQMEILCFSGPWLTGLSDQYCQSHQRTLQCIAPQANPKHLYIRSAAASAALRICWDPKMQKGIVS